MRAGLAIRLGRLDQAIEGAIARVAALPEGMAARSPARGGWSPLDALQHLVLVHEGVALVLERSSATLPQDRFPSWWRPAVMRLVLRSGIRVKAPTARVIPVALLPIEPLAERWWTAEARIGRVLEEKGRGWSNGLVFRHPLSGWLDAEETLDFLADHLGHHLRQLSPAAETNGH